MKTIALAALTLSFLTTGAFAAVYNIVPEQSSIRFSGTHAGTPFAGTAETWTADIQFDEAALAASKISATIQADSLKTGNKMYDGTLPKADWFNTAETPDIRFVSTEITKVAERQFSITGDLSLRGTTQRITFPFTLTEVDATTRKAQATVVLDRMSFGIGAKSDPDAQWVGREITLELVITAKK